MNTRKKLALAEIIRESRQSKYKTAKDFWSDNQDALGASYTHYAAVETGTKLPDIELAISIAKILKLDLRLICHVWAKDQMPDAETKAFFEPIPGFEVQGVPSTLKMNLDEFFVFTEAHLPVFEKHPQAWGMLTFILAFSDVNPPTEKQLSELFELSSKQVKEIVEFFRNEGIVFSNNGKLITKRRYFHLPNTPDFKKVRDRNFLSISQDLIKKITTNDLKEKEAFRTTYLRRITRVQAQEISRHIDDLVGHFGNLPDAGSEFYGLTIAFGSRMKFGGKNSE